MYLSAVKPNYSIKGMISNSDFEKLWFLYKAKESWSRTFFRLASSKKRLEVERTITITMGRFAQNRKKIYQKIV